MVCFLCKHSETIQKAGDSGKDYVHLCKICLLCRHNSFNIHAVVYLFLQGRKAQLLYPLWACKYCTICVDSLTNRHCVQWLHTGAAIDYTHCALFIV